MNFDRIYSIRFVCKYTHETLFCIGNKKKSSILILICKWTSEILFTISWIQGLNIK